MARLTAEKSSLSAAKCRVSRLLEQLPHICRLKSILQICLLYQISTSTVSITLLNGRYTYFHFTQLLRYGTCQHSAAPSLMKTTANAKSASFPTAGLLILQPQYAATSSHQYARTYYRRCGQDVSQQVSNSTGHRPELLFAATQPKFRRHVETTVYHR